MLALKTGVMWPQVQGYWRPPEAARSQGADSYLEPRQGLWPC